MTITEALQEIKTISKKIEKKREFVLNYMYRHDAVRDPLEKEGGSAKQIEQERQAILDLETRIVALRRGIQKANEKTEVTVGGATRTISDWLIWRREVAPQQDSFYLRMNRKLNEARDQAKRYGGVVKTQENDEAKLTDFVVNINELNLSKDIESLQETISTLDGQLSLKNATVLIEE